MTRGDPRLSGLSASVPPLAALWMVRLIPEIEDAAAWWERQRRPDIGRDLRVAVVQFRLAAAQVDLSDGVPRIGNAEEAESEMGGGLKSDPPRTMTVAEAAGLLGYRSGRQVINLIHGKVLKAVQRGPGCTWVIDRQSVLDLIASRRQA